MYIVVSSRNHWVFGPYDTAALASEGAEKLGHKEWSVHFVSPLLSMCRQERLNKPEDALKIFLEEAHDIEAEARDDYLHTFGYMQILSDEEIDTTIYKMDEKRKILIDGLCKFRKTMSDQEFHMVRGMADNCYSRGVEITERQEQ